MSIVNDATIMINRNTENGETIIVTGQFSPEGAFTEFTNTKVSGTRAIAPGLTYQPKQISEVPEPEDSSEGSKKKK